MRFAFLFTLLAAPTLVSAEPLWKGKDLQILPKDISKEKLKEVMKRQAEALGVDCDFCHKPPDMHLDTDHKKIAREMMRMVNDINKHFFKGKPKVECVMCHRGQDEPKI